ncbi:MAG: OmpP1/FadL family transporter [Mucilaginibacter sp.]|uniref:OmpP1/FadL family transporter n=1 Tax=Mucilaginibacter sp. TaxID=1882438 RepID=UPI0034E55FC3
MNLKYALTGVAIVAASQVSYAQYSGDAFRFSQTQTGATARIKAIGGASTAVGGDLSSVSGNPAGLGFFTKSELSVTPEFNGSKVESNYFGQNNNSNKNQVNLNNASVVFYNRLSTPRGRDKTKGWLSFNLGASYNRTNNFYQNTYYAGRNPNGSISDYYAQLANKEVAQYGNFASNDNTLQAWAVNQQLSALYDASPTSPKGYYSNVTSLNNSQNNSVVTSGGQSEISLSGGANYSNKLYLGFGIGITDLRFNRTSVFNETGTSSIYPNNNFNTAPVPAAYSSQYFQNQITTGTGFNARVGFIYKPVEAVRIGVTYTSPTWMTIADSYLEGLQTQYAQSGVISNSSNPGDYDVTYNLRTPMKVSGGVAVFVGKYGFISGDVEYVDYKGMHLSSGDYDNSQDNTDLSTLYKSTVNARVGAEAKLEDFFIRGGFNYQGNPQVGIGSPIKTTSAGLGYRFGKYYVDATYQYITRSTTIYPYQFDPIYSTDASPAANLKNTYNNAFLTLGMRF